LVDEPEGRKSIIKEKIIFIVSYLSKQRVFEGSSHTMQAVAATVNLLPSRKRITPSQSMAAGTLNSSV